MSTYTEGYGNVPGVKQLNHAGTLPFTGLDLGIVLVLGVLLVLAGAWLRRATGRVSR